MTTFRDALAPLAAGIVREHDVLHVAAELSSDEDSVQRARAEILRWAQKRSGGQLPPHATAGGSFDLLAAGRSTSALAVDLPQITAWALRQEDPDKHVAGRVWTSEAILWRTPDRAPLFAARLIVGTKELELRIAHATPGYVRQLADNVGLINGGRALPSAPWYVLDETGQKELLSLLVSTSRSLPILVISAIDQDFRGVTLDVDKIAAALCGLAQVAVILPSTSWALTEQFGRRLSVFDRGARIYMPHFSEESDRFAHPLWLGAQLASFELAASVDREIRERLARFSTRAVRLGIDVLPFAQIRSMSLSADQGRLAARGASASEKLSAAESRISAIAAELKEAKDLEQYALEETEKAHLRAEEAEGRERNATAQIQILLLRLADVGERQETKVLPTTWDNFEDWTDTELAGRVVFTGVARRGCRKAMFADVPQVARCLIWLARECRDRFLRGGGTLRDEAVEGGIRNSSCGSDEFTFEWNGQRLLADWHVKTGGNTRDPINCLRVYYAWHQETQQIVIADMPGHRHSGAT